MTEAPKPGILDRILGDPYEAKHYEAIGRFIIAYATAEAFAHVALRQLCGINDRLGRAIFSGSRISEITEKFRAVARSKDNEKLYTEVDTLLLQLSAISTARGKLVHRESRYDDKGLCKGLIVSNAKVTKNLEEIDFYTLQDIRQMTLDCTNIALRFRIL